MAGQELIVNASLRIPHSELEVSFVASGGPGGQHANRSNTKVELRWDVMSSSAVSERQRALIKERLGDDVRVTVDDARSQTRNRALADQRLAAKLRDALHVDAPRTPTKPTKASRRRRAEAKRARSQTKQNRRRPSAND